MATPVLTRSFSVLGNYLYRRLTSYSLSSTATELFRALTRYLVEKEE